MASKFTAAYAEIVDGLSSRAFATEGDWPKLVARARKLVNADGFNAGEASPVGDLRKKLARDDAKGAGEAAGVWGDKLDVVYIEKEFFGKRNTLTGLTNWARIVVHELTHREIKTKDHAYEHQGINPKKLTEAKAIENADSWAWFCADCAGALIDGVIKNARSLKRCHLDHRGT